MPRLPTDPFSDAVVEKIADLAHERWSGWMKYLFSKCYVTDEIGVLLPPGLVERWQRQMETDYADLTDAEKESDREEARAYLRLIFPPITLEPPKEKPEGFYPPGRIFP
jgi:hypothetical protein